MESHFPSIQMLKEIIALIKKEFPSITETELIGLLKQFIFHILA